MSKPDLSAYDNSDFNPGKGFLFRTIWFYLNSWILKSYLFPVSSLKIFVLRLFGAKIGRGVVIKPNVNIKYPWNLSIGDYTWIGEGVWIDNLTQVTIERNCCISQNALLFCGNHNFKKVTFDLMTQKVELKEGSWVGANATVCPGVVLFENAILTAGSVATSSLDENGIYQGNPAQKIKERTIS